eukprot:SAG11_NODE_2491_length_3293_cov_2.356606_2_plen_538_part_00
MVDHALEDITPPLLRDGSADCDVSTESDDIPCALRVEEPEFSTEVFSPSCNTFVPIDAPPPAPHGGTSCLLPQTGARARASTTTAASDSIDIALHSDEGAADEGAGGFTDTPFLRDRCVLSVVTEDARLSSSSFSGSSAEGRKRMRTPCVKSPHPGMANVALSAAISRQNSRERCESEGGGAKRVKRHNKSRKKPRKSPHAMFEELGCACSNCRSATSTLTRGISTCKDAIQLDEKSWLECFDKKHRYGAHLRPYYKRWLELGTPGKHFWSWLDSEPYVDLKECPRDVLERDVVTYLSASEREQFRVFASDGLIRWQDGRTVMTPEDEEWIFVVAAKDGHMYCHRKIKESNPRFQHTSFLGAEAVRVAGKLCVQDGKLVSLNLHSGHYRPREDRDLVSFLLFLEDGGFDLAQIRVDVQRIIKTARDDGVPVGTKKRKRETAKLWRGSRTVWYLEHKKLARAYLRDIELLAPVVEQALVAGAGSGVRYQVSYLMSRMPGLRALADYRRDSGGTGSERQEPRVQSRGGNNPSPINRARQ